MTRAGSLNQPLAGRLEPAARSWRTASPAAKLAFYREAGHRAVAAKRVELARAIGSNGRRMRPRKHPRPDGANGPVLTPHDDASRTARLLASRATARGVTLFWHAGIRKGQKLPWGTILGFHARGEVRGAPVRDVRLSTRGLTQVKKELAAWWTTYLRAQARARRPPPPPRPPGRIRQALDAITRKAQAAITRRYPSLAEYLRDPKDGFR